MKSPRIFALLTLAACLGLIATLSSQDSEKKPLKALLIAGGCCHDYKGQHAALYKGIQERAHVRVDVVWTEDKSVDPRMDWSFVVWTIVRKALDERTRFDHGRY